MLARLPVTWVGMNMKSTFHSFGRTGRVAKRLFLVKASCSGREKRVVQEARSGIHDLDSNIGSLTPFHCFDNGQLPFETALINSVMNLTIISLKLPVVKKGRESNKNDKGAEERQRKKDFPTFSGFWLKRMSLR